MRKDLRVDPEINPWTALTEYRCQLAEEGGSEARQFGVKVRCNHRIMVGRHAKAI